MNYNYYTTYANKTLPQLWYSQRIPEMYSPDPDDYPNQETGLYHNYESTYNENFKAETETWQEDYLNTYGDIENYTVFVYFSDDDLSD